MLIIPRSKIVENLAVINYDTNNLYLAPYDWRVSYHNLEERDGYFSKLKVIIEGLRSVPQYVKKKSLCNIGTSRYRKRQNKKVVVAAHSMGSTVSGAPRTVLGIDDMIPSLRFS